MVVLYVLCGIPGSGKTTLSKELLYKYNAKLYCYDELRKNRQPNWDAVSKHMFFLVKQSLLNGQDVIVDNLHITTEQRLTLLSSIQDVECKKILIVVQTPIEFCIERDNKRETHNLGEGIIRHYYNKYQPPSLDEGWDDIVFIENF